MNARPFLLFVNGGAEAAMTFYASVIPDCRVDAITRYPDGTVQHGRFTSETDLHSVATALSEGGSFLMPPVNYGFSALFCWLQDRYGVSWQLNLPSPKL